ncbi:MAG TPA: hypothetical protein VF846_09995 [Thermoanaerobaculia bacterium]|jgi:hypothetical protein
MKRPFFALAVLLAVAQFASAEVILEPRQPRENKPFEIIFRDVSATSEPPRMPVVTIAPGAVTIEFTQVAGNLTATRAFGERVHVNGLPAGTYTLIVKSAEEVYENTTFTVLPAPFSVSPSSGTDSSEIVIEGIPIVDCGNFCVPLEVRFSSLGGPAKLATNVRITPEGAIVARVPPGGGQGTDITVRTSDGLTHTLPRAFDYGPDDVGEDREWVMFPLNFRGQGAHGSDWRTDIVVRNDGPVSIATEPMLYSGTVVPGFPIFEPLPPGAEVFYPEEESEGGAYLYMPRGAGKWLTYSSHIADRSQSATDRGTEIPVVHREDTASQIRLLNIPMNGAFRARLRVYDFDNTNQRRRLTVVVTRADGTKVEIPLRFSPQFCGVTGCDPRPPLVSLDLSSDPRLADAGVIDVTVTAETNDARIWAFVSVSNNATQRVTLFTPQHKTPGGVQ